MISSAFTVLKLNTYLDPLDLTSLCSVVGPETHICKITTLVNKITDEVCVCTEFVLNRVSRLGVETS